jgi:ATPase family AAA domain-containing protein 3A/B
VNTNPQSIHGFDPDALERAAKAAKALDSSKNSQSAIRLIQEQEITKQKESEMERAKFQAMQEQLAIQKLQESEKVAQRTLEEQTRHDRSRAEYRDQLERKRMVDQINAQRHLQDEERKKAEDSLRKQEEIRRKTLEYEAQLRQLTEIARVKAEAEGRTIQERQNHDLTIENMKLEAAEFRETVMSGIKLAGTIFGDGFQNFLSDKEKLTNTVITISAIAFGISASRMATGVVGKYIESRLGKPSLIRETSRYNISEAIRSPVKSLRNMFIPKSLENVLKNTVYEPNLENKLRRVALSTNNMKKNSAPFRNVLLAGPPGYFLCLVYNSID